ncbi:hypothetical protein [Thermanaeromonas sp. C210]|nr:hypothetical protein [Thermanaeromonas sp. C210]GFN24299.1 hypothetical protein TAMC210_26170 [Thermanaeromonas sp. C210]
MGTVGLALELMAIALPTMFGVILLFMLLISALTRIFPPRKDTGE